MQSKIDRAEWLINRALKDGDNRKMRRALNVSLKINQWNRNSDGVKRARRELSDLTVNMRKYRKWLEETVRKEHGPNANPAIRITETDDAAPDERFAMEA